MSQKIFCLILSICCYASGWTLLSKTKRQTPCPGGFQCFAGECINQSDVCNGLSQCSDDSDESPQTCDCGLRVEVTRNSGNAAGVRNAQIGSHPWHVGIYRRRPNSPHTLLCTGALIYSNIIITSANCVIDVDSSLTIKLSDLQVSLGKIKRDFSIDEHNEQKSGVEKIVVLDYYEGDTKGYLRNLALIKIKRNIVSTFFVRPICLWSARTIPASVDHASIVGWGLQYEGSYGINLREANVKILDISPCRSKYYHQLFKKFLTGDKFCLTFEQGIGLRDDDNGGPVTIFHEGRHYLIGIISKQAQTGYGIATKISKHINWIKNSTYYLKQAGSCLQGNHFNCLSDSSCITVDKVCNGQRDCSDGSDEHLDRCSQISKQPSFGLTGKKCIIPERFEIFKLQSCGDPSVGCSSQYSAPSYSKYQLTCPAGYGFAKPDTQVVTVVCNDGDWIPNLDDNRCFALCPKLSYKSLDLTCFYLGSDVSCEGQLKPSTQIFINCKKQFKKQPLIVFANRTECRRDGTIGHEISECIPECGLPFDTTQTVPLVSNGQVVVNKTYPWHVALYWKGPSQDELNNYVYKCGASLIDTNKVLTAAHCIWDLRNNVMVKAENVAVVCGKIHSNWLIRDTHWEQRVKVEKIITGLHYNGAKSKHSQDIAVLILATDVVLSDYIMPVCLDLEGSAGGIPPNQPGHIIGWGSVSDDESKPSEVLLETWMDYLDLNTCRNRFELHKFSEYLQPDKFCALYRNGSGTQTGDSGGGLTFIHNNLHYVYGVVSIKKKGQNEFAAFTDVLVHGSWLQNILKIY